MFRQPADGMSAPRFLPGWLRGREEEKVLFPREEPARPALHNQIDQARIRMCIRVDSQGAIQQGLEFLHILLLHGHGFGERDDDISFVVIKRT